MMSDRLRKQLAWDATQASARGQEAADRSGVKKTIATGLSASSGH
jgi:hypothetical protein